MLIRAVLTREWLYWYDEQGQRFPIPEERIKLAEQRASVAEQRARILEEKLRALGVDPETLG